MANYFVINNKFKPYSFDELIKPYQMYADEYRRQEAALDAAREKEFSSTYLNPDLDKEAYTMYNQATGDLQSVSDELSSKGLSAGLRSRIRSTARDYKNTMDALNTAQARLYAEQERRAKLGPDYVFQQNNIRIGDFLNGNTPNQRGQSLKQITNDIATEFAARAQSITNDTWSKAMDNNGKVIGGYYDVTTETGLKQAQLDTILSDDATWNAIMRDQSISKAEKQQLQGFRNDILAKKKAIDFDSYDPNNQTAIEGAIRTGAFAGLGTTTHKYHQDPGYNPLGWTQYYENKRLKQQELQAKYPQYQFDKEGNIKVDNTGAPIINEGWSQDKNGKWRYKGEDKASDDVSADTQDVPERKFDAGLRIFDKEGRFVTSQDKQLNGKSTLEGFDRVSTGYIYDEDGKQFRQVSDKVIRDLANQMGIRIDDLGEISDDLYELVIQGAHARGTDIFVKDTQYKDGKPVSQKYGYKDYKTTPIKDTGLDNPGILQAGEQGYDENDIPE